MVENKLRTHLRSSPKLIGTPVSVLSDESATATVETIVEMAVDEWGLVHGGFTFGLADFAAMITVNEPNVVLTAATVDFLAPVKVGEVVVAKAKMVTKEGYKRLVDVECFVGDRKVLKGRFSCAITRKHVLESIHQ